MILDVGWSLANRGREIHSSLLVADVECASVLVTSDAEARLIE